MSTPSFNESEHPRGTSGQFASKNHAEAQIDLPGAATSKPPLGPGHSAGERAAEAMRMAQFKHTFGEQMAYAAGFAPAGVVGVRRYPEYSCPDVEAVRVGGDAYGENCSYICGVDAAGDDVDLPDDGSDASVWLSTPFDSDNDEDLSVMDSPTDAPIDGLEYRFADHTGDAARARRADALASAVHEQATVLRLQASAAQVQAHLGLEPHALDGIESIEFGEEDINGVFCEAHYADRIEQAGPVQDDIERIIRPFEHPWYHQGFTVDVNALRSWRPGEDTDTVFQVIDG